MLRSLRPTGKWKKQNAKIRKNIIRKGPAEMNKEKMLEYTLRYPPTPITDEQIAAFEAKAHLRLPSDFKRFLKKWNGGDFACHDEFRIFDFTDPSNIGVDKDVVDWFIDDEDFPDVDPDSVDVLWFGDDGSEGWF